MKPCWFKAIVFFVSVTAMFTTTRDAIAYSGVPYVFEPRTLIQSSHMNQNFASIKNAINEIETDLSVASTFNKLVAPIGNMIDIRMFVRTDGVTDSAGWVAACASANANKKLLFFPQGITINAGLANVTFSGQSGIWGCGKKSVIKNAGKIQVSGADNVFYNFKADTYVQLFFQTGNLVSNRFERLWSKNGYQFFNDNDAGYLNGVIWNDIEIASHNGTTGDSAHYMYGIKARPTASGTYVKNCVVSNIRIYDAVNTGPRYVTGGGLTGAPHLIELGQEAVCADNTGNTIRDIIVDRAIDNYPSSIDDSYVIRSNGIGLKVFNVFASRVQGMEFVYCKGAAGIIDNVNGDESNLFSLGISFKNATHYPIISSGNIINNCTIFMNNSGGNEGDGIRMGGTGIISNCIVKGKNDTKAFYIFSQNDIPGSAQNQGDIVLLNNRAECDSTSTPIYGSNMRSLRVLGGAYIGGGTGASEPYSVRISNNSSGSKAVDNVLTEFIGVLVSSNVGWSITGSANYSPRVLRVIDCDIRASKNSTVQARENAIFSGNTFRNHTGIAIDNFFNVQMCSTSGNFIEENTKVLDYAGMKNVYKIEAYGTPKPTSMNVSSSGLKFYQLTSAITPQAPIRINGDFGQVSIDGITLKGSKRPIYGAFYVDSSSKINRLTLSGIDTNDKKWMTLSGSIPVNSLRVNGSLTSATAPLDDTDLVCTDKIIWSCVSGNVFYSSNTAATGADGYVGGTVALTSSYTVTASINTWYQMKATGNWAVMTNSKGQTATPNGITLNANGIFYTQTSGYYNIFWTGAIDSTAGTSNYEFGISLDGGTPNYQSVGYVSSYSLGYLPINFQCRMYIQATDNVYPVIRRRTTGVTKIVVLGSQFTVEKTD